MYRTSFQCPVSGQTVIATYAFGRVRVRVADESDEGDVTPETEAYCQKYTNKRCRSLGQANEYIVKVSDGQTFGFE